MPASWSPAATHAISSPVPYDVHRFRLGVGETAAELGGEVALECNLDGLHGVSFTKGCYIGQELTSRTHFRGVIRKRVMPFTLPAAGASPPHVARGDAVCDAATGAPLGRVLAFHPGAACGLALLRLGEPQQRHRIACAGEQAEVEVRTPAWWPTSWLTAAAGQT
jgi:folate-binding protein YgfZ